MKTRWICTSAPCLLAAVIATALPAVAQVPWVNVTVVNIVPWDQSAETKTDSEPNLAVNPYNTQHMAASAFTPGLESGTLAPIYVSTDGGRIWNLKYVVPGRHSETGTGDITLRFGSTSNLLYAAVVRKDVSPRRFNILRTADTTSTSPSPMQSLVEHGGVDQPYVEAITTVSSAGVNVDRVYVGYGDVHPLECRKAATIERSLDASNTLSSPVFKQIPINDRDTGTCTDLALCGIGGVRPAIHASGKIYAAFLRWTACGSVPWTADVVVVRDDNWADDSVTTPFSSLVEPSDLKYGRLVATGVRVPYDLTLGAVGKQRLGTQLSIAVDPSNDQRVYLAWSDGTSPANFTMHLRRSTDGGATWSPDLRTIVPATNPSLAIDSSGKVGFLYQKLLAGPPETWETRLEISRDDFASPSPELPLHSAPDNLVAGIPAGPLGDYNHLMAVGGTFFGVFSGSNNPNEAVFPQGVTYQRNKNFTSSPKKLLTTAGTEVVASIDTFLFEARETINLGKCSQIPWLCVHDAIMKRGRLTLNCVIHRCIVIDVLAKNCIYKFNCPGCGPGGSCPPHYHLHLSGLKDAWRVGVFDGDGKPVEHRQFKTKTGVVVSFRPAKDKFVDGRIGSYLLAFEMEPKGKIGTDYQVKTRLVRSDRHYEPAARIVAKGPR